MSLIPASIRWRFVTVLPMFVLAACAGSTSDNGTPGGQGGSTMGTAVAGAGGNTTTGGTGGSNGGGTGGSTVTGAGGANRPGTGGMVGGGGSDMGAPPGRWAVSPAHSSGRTTSASANSDDWLVQNHDKISQLRPRVLAIDIGNTANATTLIQRHIDGLANATSFHKYKNAAAQPTVVYQLVEDRAGPRGPSTNYTDVELAGVRRQQHPDEGSRGSDRPEPDVVPAVREGRHQRGLVHGQQNQTKCGETQERSQSTTPTAREGRRPSSSARPTATRSPTSVARSRAHHRLQLGRGAGCHQHAMGHALGALHGRAGGSGAAQAGGAVPELGSQHARARRSATSTAPATATACS